MVAVGTWVGSVDADRKSFKEFMTKIDGKIDRILECLSAPPAVKSSSRVQLTDFGKKISETVKASRWAETHAPELVAAATGKEEVFDICVDYITTKNNTHPDFQRNVRAEAYQHGTDTDTVLKVYDNVNPKVFPDHACRRTGRSRGAATPVSEWHGRS